MAGSSSGGFKLTTVICVVIIMAITAFLSGNSAAENSAAESHSGEKKGVEKTQAEE